MKTKLVVLLIFSILLASVGGWVTYRWYSFIFAKTVQGEIVGIERVTNPGTIIATGNGSVPASQVYSFAVAIRDEKTGEIVTASSDDRQWAVVTKGLCAVAKFFPYPFWDLEKANTYFGARLERLYDCAGKPAGAPSPAAPKQ